MRYGAGKGKLKERIVSIKEVYSLNESMAGSDIPIVRAADRQKLEKPRFYCFFSDARGTGEGCDLANGSQKNQSQWVTRTSLTRHEIVAMGHEFRVGACS
jgi:hypothetical protein